jgi:hypothetical protein
VARKPDEHQEAPWRAPASGGNDGLTEEAAQRVVAERRRCDGVRRLWGVSRWPVTTRPQPCTSRRETERKVRWGLELTEGGAGQRPTERVNGGSVSAETKEERQALASEVGRQGPVNAREAAMCLGTDERRAGQKRGMGAVGGVLF